MRKTIPPQDGAGFELKSGQLLKVIDPLGQQVSDLFCFGLKNSREALSSGRSIDYEDTFRFTTGNTLFSQMGNPMLKILDDKCGCHDFLVTPCSLQMFQMIGKNQEYHPSCLENLEKAFAQCPSDTCQIGTTFNIFMNVTWDEKGRIEVCIPTSKPGDYIVFEACMDLAVGLTACSHPGSNGGRCKPVEYEIMSAI